MLVPKLVPLEQKKSESWMSTQSITKLKEILSVERSLGLLINVLHMKEVHDIIRKRESLTKHIHIYKYGVGKLLVAHDLG